MQSEITIVEREFKFKYPENESILVKNILEELENKLCAVFYAISDPDDEDKGKVNIRIYKISTVDDIIGIYKDLTSGVRKFQRIHITATFDEVSLFIDINRHSKEKMFNVSITCFINGLIDEHSSNKKTWQKFVDVISRLNEKFPGCLVLHR